MSDLKIAQEVDSNNPIAGDLYLDALGQVALSEADNAIQQHVRIRLLFFLAEWFLDLRLGVPYFRDVFVKNPNIAVLRSTFRRVILGTPGVQAVTRLDLSIDRRARIFTLSFEARSTTGGILTFAPFVLTP